MGSLSKFLSLFLLIGVLKIATQELLKHSSIADKQFSAPGLRYITEILKSFKIQFIFILDSKETIAHETLSLSMYYLFH